MDMADEKKDMKSPVFKAKIGAFEAAVFLNEQKSESTDKVIKVPSVTFQKSWTSNGKDWDRQKVNFFSALEIDKAISVLQEVKLALYKKDFAEDGE